MHSWIICLQNLTDLVHISLKQISQCSSKTCHLISIASFAKSMFDWTQAQPEFFSKSWLQRWLSAQDVKLKDWLMRRQDPLSAGQLKHKHCSVWCFKPCWSLWKGCIFWKLWYMDDGLLPKINRKGFSSNAASKSKPIHQRPKALPLSELLGLPPHVWSWSTQLNVKFCRTCACTPKRSNGPSPKKRIEIAHWTSYERFLEGLCPFDGRLKQHFPILKTAGP